MSNVEWLAGSVVIPASEVAQLKRAFRKRHNDRITKAYDEAKRFRAANVTTSMAKWHLAIERATIDADPRDTGKHLALSVARSMEKPLAIKWENFEENGLGKMGVGATEMPLFSQGGERLGTLHFQSRRLTWEIFEGNYSVDRFKDGNDAAFLYDTLSAIPWVKGTGGGESHYSELSGEITVSRQFGSLKRRYEHNYPAIHTLP